MKVICSGFLDLKYAGHISVTLILLPSTTHLFCIIQRSWKEHRLSTWIWKHHWRTKDGKWISSNDALVWQTSDDTVERKAPLCSSGCFPQSDTCALLWAPSHHTQDLPATGSQRDTRLSIHVAVWVRGVYWQKRGAVLLLDTKTEWMVHVNYKSPMNHLVFS